MLSDLEKSVIEDSLNYFQQRLCGAVPLRHFSGYSDESRIRNAAKDEADESCSYFKKQLRKTSICLEKRRVLLNAFRSQLETVVARYVSVHQNCKTELKSFLQTQIGIICTDYRTSLDIKLRLNPDTDLLSVEEFCENGMLSAINYFRTMWMHGDIGTFVDQKKALEQKLNEIKSEVLENRRIYFDQLAEQNAVHVMTDIKIEAREGLAPGSRSEIVPDSHVPAIRSDGHTPILKALRGGQNRSIIQKLLREGENANSKTSDGMTAAHLVISSLLGKRFNSSEALAVLNLLITNGFTLINEKTKDGRTPLSLAMEYHDLDESLICWFHSNRADFNAVELKHGNSVLFIAILFHQSLRNIVKLIDFGANVNFLNYRGDNIIHIAALCGHDSVLEHFIDNIDFNRPNQKKSPPLNLLFAERDVDYVRCLKIFLSKGADFKGANTKDGYRNTLEFWLKHAKQPPFPALINVKNSLPISEEIASTTITLLIEDMPYFRKFIESSSHENDAFAKFFLFLMENKQAKLLFPEGIEIKPEALEGIATLTREFYQKLKFTRLVQWKGSTICLTSASLKNFNFHTDEGLVSYSTEAVLGCLLACEDYKQFVKLAMILAQAMLEVRAKKLDHKSSCAVQ